MRADMLAADCELRGRVPITNMPLFSVVQILCLHIRS